MTKLHQEPAVIELASKLQLDWRDPINAITDYCKKKLRRWIRAAGEIHTIEELEQLVCRNLRLVFEEIWTDDDLGQIVNKYLRLREHVFAKLRDDFDDQTYATLLERHNIDGRAFDRYVAVIDCRGSKSARRFFTRWHEIAHLLTMPQQLRLPFHRSDYRDPVERLMDVVAGEIGFYEPLFRPVLLAELRNENMRLSFATVDRVRSAVCPEASFQATLAACVKGTPTPIVYIEAGMGLRAREQRELSSEQTSLFARPQPEPRLRALKVVRNDAARNAGLRVSRNMRIPPRSIAYFEEIVTDGEEGEMERSGIENLKSWVHSDGRSLPNCLVHVEARRFADRIIALICPARPEED